MPSNAEMMIAMTTAYSMTDDPLRRVVIVLCPAGACLMGYFPSTKRTEYDL